MGGIWPMSQRTAWAAGIDIGPLLIFLASLRGELSGYDLGCFLTRTVHQHWHGTLRGIMPYKIIKKTPNKLNPTHHF